MFDQDDDGARDPDHEAERMRTGRVAVPTHFYKIILHERPNGFIDNVAILLPHTDENIPSDEYEEHLKEGITSIRSKRSPGSTSRRICARSSSGPSRSMRRGISGANTPHAPTTGDQLFRNGH